MAAVFLKVLNMSIAAGWLVLAVVLLRLLLKKAPKWTHVLLWGLVAVRLLLPFSIESALSLIPSADTIPETVLTGPSFDIQSGIPPVDDRVNGYLGSHYYEGVTRPAGQGLQVMSVLTVLWLAGMGLMTVYCAISYLRLRRQVSTAVRLRERIFQSEHVRSPFVLGILRPRIYLPMDMETQEQALVIAHELSHIRRRDHWWKPLGFVLLSIHWFNPLLWLAYALLCRDIELACDEKVVKALDPALRADYSQALLRCSVSRSAIAACPLAFGEVGVKERVKNVLNYKKPAFWLIIAAVIVCVAVAVCFLTDPKEEPQDGPVIEVTPSAVTVWYEYDNPEYSQGGQWTLDAFPGVTFAFEPGGKLTATANGEQTVIPTYANIQNIYVTDLNGDGCPEICTDGPGTIFSSASFCTSKVLVYDYANQARYTMGIYEGVSILESNLHLSGITSYRPIISYPYNYSLRVENGHLICEQKSLGGEEAQVTGLLALLDTADGAMLYLAPLPDELVFPKSYAWQGTDEFEQVSFTLFRDGTFTLSPSLVSSYLAQGTYTLSGDTLTLTCDSFVYTFTVLEDGLQFELKGASGIGIPDGAIFQRNTAEQ